MSTDRELLLAMAAGDEHAAESLYAEYAPLMTVRLRSRESDAEVIEEAVQDAFVKAWRRPEQYRDEGPLGAWLGRIADRALIDVQRRRQRPVTLPESQPSPSAEDEALADQLSPALAAAWERLPTDLRRVLQATVLDEKTVGTTSSELGVPAGTVKSRSWRARNLLRSSLS
jgi:RNA polymerase sigma-70 factor (ECF subfamily)